MPFNKEISGYQNEHQFSKYLNGKKVRMLNPIMRGLINKLYGKINEELRIHAKVDYESKKFDMIINIDNITKRISIKKGIKSSVHAEGISSFIHFLIENNVKRETIIEYLKYHYADGTTNGTGKKRQSVEEYKVNNQQKIDLINNEINKPLLLEKAINRFVLQGKNSSIKIDAIIYGVVDDFIWITSDDIIKVIMSKIDEYSTSVHFGPLTCQPMNRCLNYNNKYENKRFCIQIKWYNISDEIIKNMNNQENLV